MIYKCPKGHDSTDPDYCSECGALIGPPKAANMEPVKAPDLNKTSGVPGTQEICPDCGTPRVGEARFCEVCRHDFQENKTGVAEAIIESQQVKPGGDAAAQPDNISAADVPVKAPETDNYTPAQKLNIVISVDRGKVSSWDGESPIKPDVVERVFPLDLDENLLGRRSANRGIYPEIEINDPGVSHRHLKFIKQPDGSFAVLELGSANGTELNGTELQAGVNTPVKAGDELTIGIWTRLKIVAG